jgi:hypothetical protein
MTDSTNLATAIAGDRGRALDPDANDRGVRKRAAVDRGCPAHSTHTVFIVKRMKNGTQLEDPQKAAGRRDPDTTGLLDRSGCSPQGAAMFFCEILNCDRLFAFGQAR